MTYWENTSTHLKHVTLQLLISISQNYAKTIECTIIIRKEQANSKNSTFKKEGMLANTECKFKMEIRDVFPLERIIFMREHIDRMNNDSVKELPASYCNDLCKLSDEISRKFRECKQKH